MGLHCHSSGDVVHVAEDGYSSVLRGMDACIALSLVLCVLQCLRLLLSSMGVIFLRWMAEESERVFMRIKYWMKSDSISPFTSSNALYKGVSTGQEKGPCYNVEHSI